jgi:HSP20 family protein
MLRNPMTWMTPFNELRREMDRLFDTVGLGLTRSPFRYRAGYPALNVWNETSALCVEAEVPGVKKEDLEIFAVGNELTIKGRRPPLEGEKLTHHRQERGTGEFTRVITLPTDVDAEKVEAVLKNGVLTVRLPKAESAKPKQIAIKTS